MHAKTMLHVLEPVVKLMRLTDGKHGASPGLIAMQFMEVDEWFGQASGTFPDLDNYAPGMHAKINALWVARWNQTDHPVFGAAKLLEPRLFKANPGHIFRQQLISSLKQIAKTPECPYTWKEMDAGWSTLRQKAATLPYFFDDLAQTQDAPSWWLDNMGGGAFEAIQWAAVRITSIAKSASICETTNSHEGAIHTAKRNRLGQDTVQMLLKLHLNLLLKKKFECWDPKKSFWEQGREVYATNEPGDIHDGEEQEPSLFASVGGYANAAASAAAAVAAGAAGGAAAAAAAAN